MNISKTRRVVTLGLIGVLILFILVRPQIAGGSNFRLGTGHTLSGTVLALSQNVILESGSTVNGSVFMLCCNLTVAGEVNGNVYLLTGNLRVEPGASVRGWVKTSSGNLSR